AAWPLKVLARKKKLASMAHSRSTSTLKYVEPSCETQRLSSTSPTITLRFPLGSLPFHLLGALVYGRSVNGRVELCSLNNRRSLPGERKRGDSSGLRRASNIYGDHLRLQGTLFLRSAFRPRGRESNTVAV